MTSRYFSSSLFFGCFFQRRFMIIRLWWRGKKSEIWVRVRLLGDTIRSVALGLDDKETSRQRWHLTRCHLFSFSFFFPPFF